MIVNFRELPGELDEVRSIGRRSFLVQEHYDINKENKTIEITQQLWFDVIHLDYGHFADEIAITYRRLPITHGVRKIAKSLKHTVKRLRAKKRKEDFLRWDFSLLPLDKFKFIVKWDPDVEFNNWTDTYMFAEPDYLFCYNHAFPKYKTDFETFKIMYPLKAQHLDLD